MKNEKVYRELADRIAAAQHCVAFTGAGVSTLSGIREFRGKDGLYTLPETVGILSACKGIYLRATRKRTVDCASGTCRFGSPRNVKGTYYAKHRLIAPKSRK